MAKLVDVILGARFGRLTVIAAPAVVNGRSYVECRCDCGSGFSAKVNRLGKHTRSCGCFKRDSMASRHPPVPVTKHGHTAGGVRSRTWWSWHSMRQRCELPSLRSYVDYGGRGIKVCDRWLGRDGFANFLADMGERPAGTTLDRKEVNGHYEPGNCQWSSVTTQNRNQRRTKLTPGIVREIVVGKYRDMTQAAVASLLGVGQTTIGYIRSGKSWGDVVAECRANAA